MNNLPEGWRWLALGEVTREESLRVGRRQEVKVLSSTKHHGLVPSDQYFKNRTIYSSDLSNYKLVPRNCFAYATNHLAEGSIGLQSQYDLACVSPVYTVFSCDLNQVDENYMFRLLKSPPLMVAYGAHEQASVDRRGAIRYRDFSRIYVLLPTKAEQRRIAEILDALDKRIDLSAEEIDKHGKILEGLGQSLIPVLPDVVAMGDEWEVVPLAEVVPSADYGISTPLVSDAAGIPTLRMGNLVGGDIDVNDIKYTMEPVSDHLKLRRRDVLFNRTNSIEHVGRTSIWRGELEDATFASYLVRLNVDVERVLPEYLVYWLNQAAILQRIRRLATPGVQQVNINPTNLRKTLIEFPSSLARQQQIVDTLDQCKTVIKQLSQESYALHLLRQGLAEDLLTGRVRVPEAEAVVESL